MYSCIRTAYTRLLLQGVLCKSVWCAYSIHTDKTAYTRGQLLLLGGLCKFVWLHINLHTVRIGRTKRSGGDQSVRCPIAWLPPGQDPGTGLWGLLDRRRDLTQGRVEVTSAATQTKAWHEERLRQTRRVVADQVNALRSACPAAARARSWLAKVSAADCRRNDAISGSRRGHIEASRGRPSERTPIGVREQH
jgi:hypothetical protein